MSEFFVGISRWCLLRLRRPRYFKFIWGFSSLTFQPALCGRFLAALIAELYINARPALIEHVLRSHTDLGVHTGVVLYGGNNIIWEYIWTHVAIAPFGIKRPLACKKCHVIRPWAKQVTSDTDHSKIKFTCNANGCNAIESFDVPQLYPVTRFFDKDPGGQWFGRYLSSPAGAGALRWKVKDGDLNIIAP
jgi:hypothetical protein